MRYALELALCVAAAGTMMPQAGAQVLADPTRPPAALLAPDDAAARTAAAPELQSVIISPAMKAAIINGQLVQLGGEFGSARLVRITESEVVLSEGGGEQVLRLYPGVKKSAATDANQKRAASSARQTGRNAGDKAGGAK